MDRMDPAHIKPDFDAMLEQDLSALPLPDDIVNDITPWRQAITYVLTGWVLSSVRLNFLLLQYLLPAIGIILMIIGFRTLRRENHWFRACFVLSTIQAVLFFPFLLLNATIWKSEVLQTPLAQWLASSLLVLGFLMILCLNGGFRAVQKKGGLTPHTGSMAALIVWYGALAVLGLIRYQGLLLILLMMVAYGLIIRSLFDLSKELDEAGYTIQAAPVRLSNRSLVHGVFIITVVGLVLGYTFFSQYPMAWSAVVPQDQLDSSTIKTRLVALGFPENVLQDLSDEEITDYQGALRVIIETMDHPVTQEPDRFSENSLSSPMTPKPGPELRITGIAVELPGDKPQWKIVHHFQWTMVPKFRGTEAIQIWPTYRRSNGWNKTGNIFGRVIYDRDGVVYTSLFHSLEEDLDQQSSLIMGTQENLNIFAGFSFPKGGMNYRGYISYAVEEQEPGKLIDSWFNYTHQQSRFQYPVQTALEFRQNESVFSSGRVFRTIQDALQTIPAG